MIFAPFLWSADSNDVVFLCNHQKITYVVRVNFGLGIEKPKIFSTPLDVDDYIKDSLSEETRKREAAILHTFSATHIDWDGPDHIIVKPNEAYYTLKNTIKLTIP